MEYDLYEDFTETILPAETDEIEETVETIPMAETDERFDFWMGIEHRICYDMMESQGFIDYARLSRISYILMHSYDLIIKQIEQDPTLQLVQCMRCDHFYAAHTPLVDRLGNPICAVCIEDIKRMLDGAKRFDQH
jgi:hypothetical protein